VLLLTVALVLAGLALLILGFLHDSVGDIYLSIACAVVAGVVLVAFSRVSRRHYARLATEGGGAAVATGAMAGGDRNGWVARTATAPTAGAERAPTAAPRAEEVTTRVPPAAAPGEAPSGLSVEPPPLDEVPAAPTCRPSTAAPGPAPGTVDAGGDGEFDEDWYGQDDEAPFPIADYDELRVVEILPLLDELDREELVEVRDREAAGRGRVTVLRRCAVLLGEDFVPLSPPGGAARATKRTAGRGGGATPPPGGDAEAAPRPDGDG